MATKIILSKESSEKQLKSYFEAVLKLSQTDNEFPINLDEVWMMVYSQKAKATAALQDNFIEGIDFYLSQNGKVIKSSEIQNGIKVDYFLSIPCLEYFIARKVRPVFDVYRKVFHKVVTGKKEVIYTESEIKKLLTEADRLVSENINKSNRLEDLNKHLKSNFDAIKQLYQDELIYKCNIVAYLYSKGLYQEWEAHYNSLK